MPLWARKRINVLPFLRMNLSWSGDRGGMPNVSWTWHLGPFSRNTGTGQTSVNLPGPVNYRTRRRRR